MLVAAYLLTHTKFYRDVLERRKSKKGIIYLSALFGLFSLYASLNDIHVHGAVMSLRHAGPIIGGFIGGPWVGLILGAIGAIDRYLIGGFSVWSAVLSSLLSGLFAGIYANRKKHGQLIGVLEATVFTVLYEIFAGGLTFALVPDFKQALDLESNLRLPLLLGNTATVGIYIFITQNFIKERNMCQIWKRLDRLHLVGQMAASISHEIRNPMSTVRGYLQHFSDKESLKPYVDQFQLMIEELDRANQIVSEYLSLAKDREIIREMTNLSELVKHICPLLESDARIANKHIRLDLQEVPSILLDPKEFKQLINNLVLNGIHAMAVGGTVTIYTYVEKGNVVLAIQDEGSGIPPDLIHKIGIPFVTTKDSGSGLGLAVCYSIVERHGAKLSFETSEHGTIFYVMIAY